MEAIETIKFDEAGLIPAILQDIATGQVLMMGYMNREALVRTLETGRAHFFSRARKKLWEKGETSGNYQTVKEIDYDCDEDTLLLKVIPQGPACHTGRWSCFFRSLKTSEGAPPTGQLLEALYQVILERRRTLPEGSYVASLFKGGQEAILRKIGEEALEVILAAQAAPGGEIIKEMADLWFHGLVLLAYSDIPPQAVLAELTNRFGKPARTNY